MAHAYSEMTRHVTVGRPLVRDFRCAAPASQRMILHEPLAQMMTAGTRAVLDCRVVAR